MSSPNQQLMMKACRKEYNVEEMYDLVDGFVSDSDVLQEAPKTFWKSIFSDCSSQQLYAKCLIYKYISFTYGLGHKPLREAVRMIKNITTHPASNTSMVVENIKPKADNIRHASVALDLSPLKRGRAFTAPGRRKSSDAKTSLIVSKISPADSSGGQFGKFKRKSSDGMSEETSSSIQNAHNEGNGRTTAKLRDLLYTISFLVNTCDLTKWDFNSLREVFLVWNKARSWEQNATSYELEVMKRFSRPPDPLSDKEKWDQALSEVLFDYHDETDPLINGSLDHRHVGNSIRYAAIRHKIRQSRSSTQLIIESMICLLEKMYTRYEERKVLSLLHIFCETVIMAPHIPLHLLQRAYSSFQCFYLLPMPLSAAVKEVLDLIQIEMKSPGYFRRTIFLQEQEAQNLVQSPTAFSPSTATNLFVDEGKTNRKTLESALNKICGKQQSSPACDELQHKRLLIEHIYHSVFGDESCDLPTLRKILKECNDDHLSQLYNESLSVMEQAVSMEDPTFAQEFIRQQLEGLSNKLVDEQDGGESLISSNTTIDSPTTSPSKFPVGDISNSKINTSSQALSSLIAPPRIHSYLSRSMSSNNCLVLGSNCDNAAKELPVVDRMDYTEISLRSFDKNQLSDAIFELVRMTAKEFVVEKRKSGGYNSAQKRYRERRRSGFVSSGDVRDSGLIEDYTEGDGSKLHNVTSPNKSDGKHSGEFWQKFSERGFAETKSISDEESLDKLLNSFRFSGLLSDDLSNESKDLTDNTLNDVSEQNELTEGLPVHDVARLPPMKKFDKPEDNDDTKPSFSAEKQRSKKNRHRFKTLGRKGIKMMRSIRRTSSARVVNGGDSYVEVPPEPASCTVLVKDSNNQRYEEDTHYETKSNSVSSTPASISNGFFDAVAEPRWRTSSLPVKNSARGKKKDKTKRRTVMQLFPSSNDVNEETTIQESHQYVDGSRFLGGDIGLAVPKAFSFNSLDVGKLNNDKLDDSSRSISVHTLPNPKNKHHLSAEGDKVQVFLDDDESRNRMDSGIVIDKSTDSNRRFSPGRTRESEWEETGVAGVKFSRKQVLRRNRRSRSSLSHQPHSRTVRKKILKLAFVGNDKTVGDIARAYYELRRRQVTRAPLLHHIDLRMYYIPLGENTFQDESVPTKYGIPPFDLEIGEMLGSVDPWYKTVVTMAANNLLRICPTINNDDDVDEPKENLSNVTCQSCLDPTADTILSSSILSYFRFAIKTSYVPLFKATMHTSTDEVISEVFCCRAEVGNVAYKQAIAAGRFGKVGKLVDLSNDTGPPAAYTTFKYKKFGINGSFVSQKTLDEAYYFRVCFVPVALSANNKDQVRFPGADGLQVSILDNEKRAKLIKRGNIKVNVSDDDWIELLGSKFTVSEAKMEVVRPVQGTFTVCLDQTLIHTNIKSLEVSRCLCPDYEKPNARKRRHSNNPGHVLSLPLKTFWPNSIPTKQF